MDFGITPEALRAGLIFYILLIACLCLRSFAQAWTANKLGDPTPESEGRLTLNPLPHLDMVGSVVLPLICILFLQPALGRLNFFLAWTKPVPVNPANFRNPRRDDLLTQLSGCGMSLLVSLFAAIAGGLLASRLPVSVELFASLIFINAMLIVLDLLPIPPLPGGALLRHLGVISEEAFWMIARWSGLVLLVAIQLQPVRVFLNALIRIVAVPFLLLFDRIAQ